MLWGFALQGLQSRDRLPVPGVFLPLLRHAAYSIQRNPQLKGKEHARLKRPHPLSARTLR